MFIFENEFFPNIPFPQRHHVDAVGLRRSFSMLIRIFVFDILVNSYLVHPDCSGCIAPTGTPRATDMNNINCVVKSLLLINQQVRKATW